MKAQHVFGAALDHHKAGRTKEAEAGYRRVLSQQPNHVDALHFLGLLAHQAGRHDAAIRMMRKALALNESVWSIHFNLAEALRASGALAEAIAHYEIASRLQPNNPAIFNNLGRVRHALGQLPQAAAAFRAALALQPNGGVHSNLGNILNELGQAAAAAEQHERALALHPDIAELHTNLGNARHRQGRLDLAAACYEQALRLRPDAVDTLNNLARLHLALGHPADALAFAARSLRTGGTADAKRLVATCLRQIELRPDDVEARGWLTSALTERWVRSGELAAAAARAVQAHPDDSDLLEALLAAAPVCDLALEQRLVVARRTLLAGADAETPPSRFEIALARQCFINEYVYEVTDNEQAQVDALAMGLQAMIDAGAQPSSRALVSLACFRPLGSLAASAWPDDLAALVAQQVTEPRAEWQDRAAIPALTPIEDAVSEQVRAQYEANPYPRWTGAALADHPTTIDSFLARAFPQAPILRLERGGDTDILIAGCGTGQQSSETAQLFPTARVLAVDLSLSSLAYARRQARALGLTNISYAQADILQLDRLDRRFDVIESSGVLHHLAEPEEGWRRLIALLRPRGLMHIGLYSATARRHVTAARSWLAERGIVDVRAARAALLGSQHRGIAANRDFYSLSTCRDLLLHVQEQSLTLPAIAAFLQSNGLRFLGFDVDPAIAQAYAARFPADRGLLDLQLWNLFEATQPDSFAGMYQFWVQKPD